MVVVVVFLVGREEDGGEGIELALDRTPAMATELTATISKWWCRYRPTVHL